MTTIIQLAITFTKRLTGIEPVSLGKVGGRAKFPPRLRNGDPP